MSAVLERTRDTRINHVVQYEYPRNEDTVRPFRLWNARERKMLPGCNFTHVINAHRKAHWEVSIGPIGTQIEVIDVRTMKLKGQYVRKVQSVWFERVGVDHAR